MQKLIIALVIVLVMAQVCQAATWGVIPQVTVQVEEKMIQPGTSVKIKVWNSRLEFEEKKPMTVNGVLSYQAKLPTCIPKGAFIVVELFTTDIDYKDIWATCVGVRWPQDVANTWNWQFNANCIDYIPDGVISGIEDLEQMKKALDDLSDEERGALYMPSVFFIDTADPSVTCGPIQLVFGILHSAGRKKVTIVIWSFDVKIDGIKNAIYDIQLTDWKYRDVIMNADVPENGDYVPAEVVTDFAQMDLNLGLLPEKYQTEVKETLVPVQKDVVFRFSDLQEGTVYLMNAPLFINVDYSFKLIFPENMGSAQFEGPDGSTFKIDKDIFPEGVDLIPVKIISGDMEKNILLQRGL